MSNLKKLRILKPEYVNKNEFWIYSAGFNVEKNPNNLSRINEELKTSEYGSLRLYNLNKLLRNNNNKNENIVIERSILKGVCKNRNTNDKTKFGFFITSVSYIKLFKPTACREISIVLKINNIIG